jgi:hypothetical protein
MKIPRTFLAAIAITIAVPAASSAQATRPGMPTTTASPMSERSSHDNVCGVRTLRGTYVFAASGFNITATGVAIPKAIVEVIEFNGDGTLSVPHATVSVNGVFPNFSPGVGTYDVENDCSGTIAFVPAPAFDIFVARDGETVWMIQTGPNPSVFQGTATRTSRSRGRH